MSKGGIAGFDGSVGMTGQRNPGFDALDGQRKTMDSFGGSGGGNFSVPTSGGLMSPKNPLIDPKAFQQKAPQKQGQKGMDPKSLLAAVVLGALMRRR